MTASGTGRLLAGLLLAALAAACGGSSSSTPTTPTTPTTPAVTETFSGTVAPSGASYHLLAATGAGTVTATITAETVPSGATPPSLGFSIGTWNGSYCTVVLANDAGRVGSVLTGTTSSATTLCVRFYDVASLFTETVSYEVTVSHP